MERMSSHTTTHILITKQVTTTLYKQCGWLPGRSTSINEHAIKPRMLGHNYLGHNHRHSEDIIFSVSYFHKLGPYFHCLRLQNLLPSQNSILFVLGLLAMRLWKQFHQESWWPMAMLSCCFKSDILTPRMGNNAILS